MSDATTTAVSLYLVPFAGTLMFFATGVLLGVVIRHTKPR